MLDWIKKNKYWITAMAMAVPLGIMSVKADKGERYREIAMAQNELLEDIERVLTK